MKSGPLTLVVALVAAISLAPLHAAVAGTPTLATTQAHGMSITAPQGWTHQFQPAPVPTLVVQEPVAGNQAATLVLVATPLQQGPATAQQLVLGSLHNPTASVKQQRPDGTTLQVWDGQTASGPGHVALLTAVDPTGQTAFIAAFGAPASKFQAYGGTDLLVAFAAGTGAPTGSPGMAAAPSAHPPQAAHPSAASSAQPLPLAQLAENIERVSPAQAAASLRALNPTDQLLLSSYPAFAGMIHLVACQADPGVLLPSMAGPTSCTATIHSWQQTLQLTGGDMNATFSYAWQERDQYLIGARCGSGAESAQTCAAYRQTLGAFNAASHETSMRIIANMSPDGCLLGDPGCVPH